MLRRARFRPGPPDERGELPGSAWVGRELGLEVSHGNVVEQRLLRVAQAVVDEADVCTPALVTDDRVKLVPPHLGVPELPEVAAEIAQAGEPPAQLAGADVTVVVDHDGGAAGGAGHRPGVWRLDVLKLDPVVQGQRSLVPGLTHGSLDAPQA